MEEKLYFNNRADKKLAGILSDPADKVGTGPIVILCHGFTSNKNSDSNKELNRLLNLNNIATFRFDFFGHGESEGDFAEITVSEGIDDILEAIKFLKDKGYSKIGLVGSSFGGSAVLITASKDSDLSFIVAKSPACDYKEIEEGRKTKEELDSWKKDGYVMHRNSKGQEFKLNYNFYQDAQKNVVYDYAKDIKIPTLIVHGDADITVPIDQSRKMAKLISNCQLKEVKGADHKYSNQAHFDEMVKLITDFIFKKLNLMI